MNELQKQLFTLQDPSYLEFHSKLIPTIEKNRIIGIRTPALRSFAKDFKGAHEAIRYIYTLFSKILSPAEFGKLKQFNLSYSNSDDFNLMAIYYFADLGLCYSYSNELGFNKITPQVVSDLLKSGWKTNSHSIQDIFDESISR